jgi:cbb3-type cytochrome oxidase maturation protein
MNVVVVLILASLVVALLFLAAFIWAVRSGQYEDTLTPSLRVLGEDAALKKTIVISETKSKNQ